MAEWTPERTEMLRTMWLAGSSAGIIADRMDITRDAVLGRVRRLGINRAGTAPKQVKAAKQPKLVRVFARIPTEGRIWSKNENKRREAFARRAAVAAREAREAAGL